MRWDRSESEPQTIRQQDHASDPLGRAMLAHHRDEPGRLTYRDGAAVRDGTVAAFYFSSAESWDRETIDALERLADRDGYGPILDVGCGAGKHLLWFAERDVAAVGVDASPNAVLTAASGARSAGPRGGAAKPRSAASRTSWSATCSTCRSRRARSVAGIRDLLAEFARVTGDGGVAVVDNYDPTRLDETFIGYRSDPREGVAHRCFHFEFEGERADGERYREIGRTLHFLLCSPARFREVTAEMRWHVRDVLRADESAHYRAVLEKR